MTHLKTITVPLPHFLGYDEAKHSENTQGGVGAAFKSMTATIVTQELEDLTPADIEDGVEPKTQPTQTQKIDIFSSDVTPIDVGGLPSDIRESGDWAIVDGFNKMKYDLVFADHNIDPRTVQSVIFDMVVAGDYNIAVIGFSDANKAAEGGRSVC